MTPLDTFERLIDLAKIPAGGAAGRPVLSCDIVHQEALYDFQEKLSMLLFELAMSIGPLCCHRLAREFPVVFKLPTDGV